MSGRRVVAVLLSAAVTVAAGCEAPVDPIAVERGCPEMPVRGPAAAADVPIDRLIDDFDDGDNFITAVAGRNGYWASMDNGTSSIIGAHASTSCAARGRAAGHFTAEGFTPHGASWTAFFAAQIGPLAVPYDGSRYSGISFWAATGSDQTPFPVALGLSTMDTVMNGGVCTVCFDYYSATVELTHAWHRFVIPYANMAQGKMPVLGPFGVPQIAMRPEALVGFLIWPDQGQFDIWIDDLRFEP